MGKLFKWKTDYKKSYSQSGEDIIIDILLRSIGIRKPTYLDIGAHDPVKFNNTYYFYKRGCSGVNIEPDPFMFKRFRFKRWRDTNLNMGVAAKEGVLDFYVVSGKTLSTFCKETAERYATHSGLKIEEILKVKVTDVNSVIKQYFQPKPNFVSLDIEGLEMEIIRNFDFGNFRPEVFCIETVVYAEKNAEKDKIVEVIDFMRSTGYMVYADTFINTIFVDERVWRNMAPRC